MSASPTDRGPDSAAAPTTDGAAPAGPRLEFAARAGAGIGVAGRDEARERVGVERGALALPRHGAVPREAVALQRGEDAGLGAGAGARRVDVLDADQPLAAGDARVAAARERCDQRAEMQCAGGRRREAAAAAR